jgi:hypothetical protein
LFFLDEPTALAAGHRPCFECRHAQARAFAEAMAAGTGRRPVPGADEIDRILHAERLDGRDKRRHLMALDDLPDGALVTLPGEAGRVFAVRGPLLLQWTPAGYAGRRERPQRLAAEVLTPPAMLAALSAGYRPHWHPSAG